jgi:hypothetical protein
MFEWSAVRSTMAAGLLVAGLAACGGSSSSAPTAPAPQPKPLVTTVAPTTTVTTAVPTTVAPTTIAPTTVPGPKASPKLPEGAPFYNNLEPDHIERTKQWIAVERWLYLDTRRYGPVTQLLVDPRGPNWTLDVDRGEQGRNVPQKSEPYLEVETAVAAELDGRPRVTTTGILRGGNIQSIGTGEVTSTDPDKRFTYSVTWSPGENGAWLIWARAISVEPT